MCVLRILSLFVMLGVFTFACTRFGVRKCDRNWFALGVDECAKLKALGLLLVANILARQSCICMATCVLILVMMLEKSCD
jgi:hypothetical protein